MTEKYVSVKFSADEAKQIKSYKAIAMRNIECMPNICVGDWGEVAQLLDWICDKIEAAPDPASAEPVAILCRQTDESKTEWLDHPPKQEWIKCSEQMPEVGVQVRCQLVRCSSGEVLESNLIHVSEDDCSWRTADDNSEISYEFDVVSWMPLPTGAR